MKCPNIETLIALATGKGGSDVSDIVLHASECSACRQNLKIIHETMLASKWQNPQIAVAPAHEPEDNRCSVCGTSYKSKTSLRQVCMEKGCKATICFDCWNRLGIRKCPEHSKRK